MTRHGILVTPLESALERALHHSDYPLQERRYQNEYQPIDIVRGDEGRPTGFRRCSHDWAEYNPPLGLKVGWWTRADGSALEDDEAYCGYSRTTPLARPVVVIYCARNWSGDLVSEQKAHEFTRNCLYDEWIALLDPSVGTEDEWFVGHFGCTLASESERLYEIRHVAGQRRSPHPSRTEAAEAFFRRYDEARIAAARRNAVIRMRPEDVAGSFLRYLESAGFTRSGLGGAEQR